MKPVRVLLVVGLGCVGMACAQPGDPLAPSTSFHSKVMAVKPSDPARPLQSELQAEVDRLLTEAAQPVVLEQGKASYYANRFHGRRTASGERYDKNALTAAHKTLPFGTEVVVRSLQTGKEVVVRIIDRGPHLKSRIIDLSHAAAEALGIRRQGVSEVQLIQPHKP